MTLKEFPYRKPCKILTKILCTWMFHACRNLSKVVRHTSCQRPRCQKTTNPLPVRTVGLCWEFLGPCKSWFRNAFAYVFCRLLRLQFCKGRNLWVERGLWRPTWYFRVWCRGKLCYFRVDIQWLKRFPLNKIEPSAAKRKIDFKKLIFIEIKKQIYLWESFEFFHPGK